MEERLKDFGGHITFLSPRMAFSSSVDWNEGGFANRREDSGQNETNKNLDFPFPDYEKKKFCLSFMRILSVGIDILDVVFPDSAAVMYK